MVRSRASKGSLNVLCIVVVFRYVFSAFTSSSVLVIRKTSLLLGSPLRYSVVLVSPSKMKQGTYCSEMVRKWHYTLFIHEIYGVNPVHIFMEKSRASESYLIDDLCFRHFVHVDCVPVFIFSFDHKQCSVALMSTYVDYDESMGWLQSIPHFKHEFVIIKFKMSYILFNQLCYNFRTNWNCS